MRISKTNFHRIAVFVIIVGSVFIDLLNGYFINNYNPLPIGIAFRLLITLFAFAYLIKYPKFYNYKIYLTIIFFLWICCNTYWIISGQDINPSIEISEFSKILYPLFIAFYLKYVLDRGYVIFETLLKWSVLNGLVSGLCILFSSLTGVGFNTYGYAKTGASFSFGTTSFFNAQNDLSLAMLLSFCCSLYFLFVNKRFSDLLKTSFIFIGLTLIGTRAGLIGGLAAIFFFVVYMIFFGDKNSSQNFFHKIITVLMIIVVAVLSGLFVYREIEKNPYLLRKYAATAIASPRAVLGNAADLYIEKKESRPLPFLFGLGNKTYTAALPLTLNISNNQDTDEEGKYAEKDLTDLIGGYGRLFAYVIFALPVFAFIRILRDFLLTPKSYLKFSLLISISVFIFHSILVGHGIKNPEVGTLLAIVYVYVFNLKKIKRTMNGYNTSVQLT